MSKHTRRRFLEDSLLATTAALAAGSATSVLADEKKPAKGPNDKAVAAVIGVRGRGGEHIKELTDRDDVDIAYVCDVDTKVGMQRVDQIEKLQGRRPNFVQDMRTVFDDDSVDVVTIATPNAWHALAAIWAMQAGKDVYVEKPVSHNVSEGRRMVEAARKYDRICQTGTQIRSQPGTIEAIKYVHDGGIGVVKLARALCYKRRPSIGHTPDSEVPEGVDYNLWLGPAPVRAFSENRFHYNWHWHWAHGNGDLGNQGIHQMDVARWALGADNLGYSVVSYGGRLSYEDDGETANTQVSIHDMGDGRRLVFEVRGLETEPLRGAGVGNIFYGDKGYVAMTGYSTGAAFDLEGILVKKFDEGGNHFANFFDAVYARDHKLLTADILEGHLSSGLCHLGNISYRAGDLISDDEIRERLAGDDEATETFGRVYSHLTENGVNTSQTPIRFGQRLAFDPESETFVDNDEANASLTRDYREPFVVPAAGQV
jgi:predicted dehydrogenase